MGRKDVAYEQIKKAILSNELAPNSPVREMELAQQLQMSRTPIREALRDLEAEGLVETYPARGTIVTAITPQDIEEIFQLRTMLEQWGLERSIYRISDQELNQLQTLFTQAYTAKDTNANHKVDRQLHRLIIEKSGSHRLVVFLNMLNAQIERVRQHGAQDQKDREISYHQHMEIIDLIRKRELDACKKVLAEHLLHVSSYMKQSPRLIDVELL